MEFLYAIINFLILAGLIFLFGRKMIVSIFRDRRVRICRELDEAERISCEEISVTRAEKKKYPTAAELAEPEIEKIRKTTEEKIRQIKTDSADKKTELRREMLSEFHNEIVVSMLARAREMFCSEETTKALRCREESMVDDILARIKLTPGDIAYLKTHDVLYVTLTSAFQLDDALVKKIDDKTSKLLEDLNGKTSFWVKVDPDLIGGVTLRIGDTIYDHSVREQLYQLEKKAEKDVIIGDETTDDIFKELEEDIVNTHNSIFEYQLGRVLTVSDGICWMDGLADIMYGEVVEFACGERGMVLDIQPGKIGCVIYGSYENIESGSRVRRVGRIASVPVGNMLLGRVVDPLGHAIDGKGRIRTNERRPIEFNAPAIPDRASVCEPLHTGIKAVDALVPIGKGQRTLIIGDRQTGKTALAIDAIINQKGKNVICIYVAIGQKDTTVADIRKKLESYGAMEYTTIVCAAASASASLQYMAPFSGTAMGEYFMYSGRDVLIIYDDLSKHAVAYRELSLLLHRPSGREAYPGDIFYLHSRLLERSAKLSEEIGGGTMTALPIIETLAGDISSYIPTNVISITDGQIFLDTELFYEGQRPAVNVGLSVSRVGGAAQTKLMKQMSASLRMQLAQYRELSGFSQFGTDVDSETQKVLDRGQRMMSALKQGRFEPLPDWKQALLLYSISEGFADDVPVSMLEIYETGMYDFIDKSCPEAKNLLERGLKLNDSEKKVIHDALEKYKEGKAWQVLNN